MCVSISLAVIYCIQFEICIFYTFSTFPLISLFALFRLRIGLFAHLRPFTDTNPGFPPISSTPRPNLRQRMGVKEGFTRPLRPPRPLCRAFVGGLLNKYPFLYIKTRQILYMYFLVLQLRNFCI